MVGTEKPCGCHITPYPDLATNRMIIAYCQLHDAAPKLLEACKAAAEWAAGYPLQGACSEADARAAATVFRLANEAITAVKEDR